MNKAGCAEDVDNLYDTSREVIHVLLMLGNPDRDLFMICM